MIVCIYLQIPKRPWKQLVQAVVMAVLLPLVCMLDSFHGCASMVSLPQFHGVYLRSHDRGSPRAL